MNNEEYIGLLDTCMDEEDYLYCLEIICDSLRSEAEKNPSKEIMDRLNYYENARDEEIRNGRG